MASAKCLVPLDAFRSKYHSDAAGGTRAFFLLGSVISLPSEHVVPRRAIILAEEDRQILSGTLNLPPDRWTDQHAIIARHSLDKDIHIGPQEIFREANELSSCSSVLKMLGDFLRSSVDKDGGKSINICHFHSNHYGSLLQPSFIILATGESFEVTGVLVMVTLHFKT